MHTYNIKRPLELQEMLDAGRLHVPVDAWIDCMDLWELCCGLRGTPQDNSQRLGNLSLREERRTLRLHPALPRSFATRPRVLIHARCSS